MSLGPKWFMKSASSELTWQHFLFSFQTNYASENYMQQISGRDNLFDALLPWKTRPRCARVPLIRPRPGPKINEKLQKTGRGWLAGWVQIKTQFFQGVQLLNWKLTYFGSRCYRSSDSGLGLAFVFGQKTKLASQTTGRKEQQQQQHRQHSGKG